jgi:hypothetical protein
MSLTVQTPSILVLGRWQGRPLGVPLAQLKPIGVDKGTAQAIADWHYWVTHENLYRAQNLLRQRDVYPFGIGLPSSSNPSICSRMASCALVRAKRVGNYR